MIAKGSEPWIFTAVSVTSLFAILSRMMNSSSINHAVYVGIALTFFVVLFFRDPERKVEVSDTYMISPADGTVIDIRDRKICIFMFFQNVHVNRAPISGKIKEITYKKGGYLPAYRKDSDRNERNEFVINSKYGDVSVIQIAGGIAPQNCFIFKGERCHRTRTTHRNDSFWIEGRRNNSGRFQHHSRKRGESAGRQDSYSKNKI